MQKIWPIASKLSKLRQFLYDKVQCQFRKIFQNWKFSSIFAIFPQFYACYIAIWGYKWFLPWNLLGGGDQRPLHVIQWDLDMPWEVGLKHLDFPNNHFFKFWRGYPPKLGSRSGNRLKLSDDVYTQPCKKSWAWKPCSTDTFQKLKL